MRFLLINPTAPEWRVPPGRAPSLTRKIFRYSMLSSMYVAAAAPAGVTTQILDEDIEPVDFDTDADLIGISLMTFNAPRAYEIADRFRKQKGKTVILGGYHPTFMPGEALEHADAVCIGEAEASVPLMIRDFLRGRLKARYENPLQHLQGLPVPDRSITRTKPYAWVDAIQATRGCPHRCTFCSISPFFRHQFRYRPVPEVVEELRSLRRHILFLDDNITAEREYAMQLFAAMRPLGKRWCSQCSVSVASDDGLLDIMSDSGCLGLFIGFESVNQGSLLGWGKGCNVARGYAGAIEKLHRKGIAVYAGFIFGNDGDTPEVFQETLQFLYDAKIDALQATVLTPFPGTSLFDDMKRQGRIVDTDWSHYDFRHVVFEPLNMSRAVLKEGHDRVLRGFYRWRSLIPRVSGEFRYLRPDTIIRATGPINLGYRSRLKADRTLR